MIMICQKGDNSKKISVLIYIALFLFLSSGCTSSLIFKKNVNQTVHEKAVYSDAERMGDRISLLEKDLNMLLGYKDEESLTLANAALNGSKELSRKYKAFRPALIHNTLINIIYKWHYGRKYYYFYYFQTALKTLGKIIAKEKK